MKNLYVAPELEIIRFLTDDVIVTSLGVNPDLDEDLGDDFEDSFGDGTTKPWG